MVKIRLGSGWREDPSVRLALARGGEEAAAVAERAADALAIEVDGVDVAAGRAEGALLPALTALAEAAARLVGGAPSAEVHLPEGTVELLLRRQGGAALLSVVSLGRPSRLLARDVAVELPALAAAVAEAGRGLAAEMAAAHPPLVRAPAVRALRRALAGLEAARPADPPARAPSAARPRRPRRRRAVPHCEVDWRDEEGLAAAYRGPGPDLGSLLAPGRVTLSAPGGTPLLSVEGVPFLLLRDLAALAARVVGAVRAGEPRVASALALPGRGRSLPLALDLRRGTLAAAGRPPAPVAPLPLAEALLVAALDFCGVVAARNPWQAGNGYLLELRRGAAAALEHLREVAAGDQPSPPRAGIRPAAARRPPRRPLGPGRLRRLGWCRAWEAAVGAPAAGPGLFRAGDLVVAAGAAAVLGLEARGGAVRWRAPGAAWAALEGRALLLASGARLARHDPSSGAFRWVRALPAPSPEALSAPVRLRGGPLLLAAGGEVAALDPATGASAWRLAPPGASALWLAPFGTLCAVAADTGLLYGLDARGGVAWRVLLPGPPAAPPVAWAGLCAVACAAPAGGALLAVDPATGRRAWEAPLDFAPGGAPLPFAGRLAVPGAVAGDPVVAAVERDGAVAWTSAPTLGRGVPALARAEPLLVVQGGAGGCCALDRAGRIRWLARVPQQGGGPPPHAVRGVVLVAGDPPAALDAGSGAPLGEARLPPPARLLVDDDLGLLAMDAEGGVAAARLAGRLGVLEGRQTPR